MHLSKCGSTLLIYNKKPVIKESSLGKEEVREEQLKELSLIMEDESGDEEVVCGI